MIFKNAELALAAAGFGSCFIYVGSLVHRTVGSQLAVRSGRLSHRRGDSGEGQNPIGNSRPATVDHRLWSQRRMYDYLDSLASQFEPPLAVLRIPAADIEAPVFEGTDELKLNRGVGRIAELPCRHSTATLGLPAIATGSFAG